MLYDGGGGGVIQREIWIGGGDNRGQYAHNKNRLFQTNVIFIVIIEAV